MFQWQELSCNTRSKHAVRYYMIIIKMFMFFALQKENNAGLLDKEMLMNRAPLNSCIISRNFKVLVSNPSLF